MRPLLKILFFFTLVSTSFSQQKLVDSLLNLVEKKSGIEKVRILNEIADTYNYISTSKALEYGNYALQLALKTGDKKSIAESYGNLGYSYTNLDNETALKYTEKALAIRKEINYKIGIAASLNVLGIIYYYQAEYLKSIDYHLQALKLREEFGDKTKIATSLNNIALVYMALADYDTALDYFQKSLNVRIQTGNKRGIGIIRDNIGDIYRYQGRYDDALWHYMESLKVNREIGNKKSEANSLANLGRLFFLKKDYKSAMDNLDQALNLYKQYDDYMGISNVETRIAQVLMAQNKVRLAIEHAMMSLSKANTIKSLENLAVSSEILHNAYQEIGDFQNAYKYLLFNKNVKDSLKNDEKLKKISKLELNYRIEKLRQQQNAEMNRQKLYNYVWAILSLSILVITLLLFRDYQTKKKTNKQLKELNDKLQELNTKKDKIFSIIGHDLKNPFNAIINSSKELADNSECYSGKDRAEILDIITKSSEAAHNLLENLLLWARSQMETITIEKKCFYIKDALNESISVLSHQALSKGIKISNRIDETTTVNADYNTICTVFRNLLNNSIKFSYPDSTVLIFSEVKENTLLISFQDYGTGISDEDKESIFSISKAAKRKGTAGESGTGLGLVLCKEFIEANGGKLSFVSKLNNGSTFTLALPIS